MTHSEVISSLLYDLEERDTEKGTDEVSDNDIDGADILGLKESLCSFIVNKAATGHCEQ